MEVFGTLIEITGIQEYIFGSNKLKINIGASDIIDKIFYSNEKIADQLDVISTIG